MQVYSINGYFKDDKTPIQNYLISEQDGTPTGYDDGEIFYHGMSESAIRWAIQHPHETTLDFVITGYRVVK